MNTPQNSESLGAKPLRLWPGVVIVLLQWVMWWVVPLVLPSTGPVGVMGGLAGGLLILVWWTAFSRAPWLERLGAVVLMVVASAVTARLVHKSIAGGMMGMMPYIYSIPLLSLGLVAWAVACRRLAAGPRRGMLAVLILGACMPLALIRTEGMSGDANSELAWRWSPSFEERLLSRPSETAATPLVSAGSKPPLQEQVGAPGRPPAVAPPAALGTKTEGEWPGFRGPDRDGVIHGVRINSNWSASPPVRLWKRAVGPGWSSFAVQGGLLFTQEQRGEEEIVACYKVADGESVWKHGDPARFWESNAGAGPRATPALHKGRVYTFGATGMLNALDAQDGKVVWSRNAAADTGKKIPEWGFAGSPLVLEDMVIIAAAGRLAAYDIATGNQRWSGPAGGWGYSSPHLAKVGGASQVVLLNGAGAIAVSPEDGRLLWEQGWRGDGIVQPALTSEGNILIGTGSGFGAGSKMGMLCVAVMPGTNGWTVAERWTSRGLKPYYNDLVLHKGCAFGFDGSLLACVDLKDGSRKWKGGRYGYGQIVLLADQDVLLVVSERGELALVRAAPDDFAELARVPGIEGKTWNHPALAGDTLLVRNSQEMAAFRLSLAPIADSR